MSSVLFGTNWEVKWVKTAMSKPPQVGIAGWPTQPRTDREENTQDNSPLIRLFFNMHSHMHPPFCPPGSQPCARQDCVSYFKDENTGAQGWKAPCPGSHWWWGLETQLLSPPPPPRAACGQLLSLLSPLQVCPKERANWGKTREKCQFCVQSNKHKMLT